MNKTLVVNEIFNSVQGEGYWSGLPVTFVRLQGCNLRCFWCDTQYALNGAGTKMAINEITKLCTREVIVLTGGEPLLQPNVKDLVFVLLQQGKRVHIETNGTIYQDMQNCWITVSPKPPKYRINEKLILITNELKYVVDESFSPEVVPNCNIPVFLQPEGNRPEMIEKALNILDKYTMWRLSLQIHKIIKIK